MDGSPAFDLTGNCAVSSRVRATAMQRGTSNTKAQTKPRIDPSLSPCSGSMCSISGCRLVFSENSHGPTSCFVFASSIRKAYLAKVNVRRA
jgi:hypothetical protein